LPLEVFHRVASHEERTVSRRELRKADERALSALAIDVNSGFRTEKSDVDAPRKQSCRPFVGAPGGAELDLEALLLKKAQRDRNVLRSVENGTHHFGKAHAHERITPTRLKSETRLGRKHYEDRYKPCHHFSALAHRHTLPQESISFGAWYASPRKGVKGIDKQLDSSYNGDVSGDGLDASLDARVAELADAHV